MNIPLDDGDARVFLRTPYNYDTDAISDMTALECEKETKTQQQFKDEVDINTIVERFGVTGEAPPTVNFPEEQDFTEVHDFQSAMNVLRASEEAFMQLPAKARARFQNSPQQFMEFIHDADNQEEAIKLGLATKSRNQSRTKSRQKRQNPQRGIKSDTWCHWDQLHQVMHWSRPLPGTQNRPRAVF